MFFLEKKERKREFGDYFSFQLEWKQIQSYVCERSEHYVRTIVADTGSTVWKFHSNGAQDHSPRVEEGGRSKITIRRKGKRVN